MMLSFASRKKAMERGEQVRRMMQHTRRWDVVAWKSDGVHSKWYYYLRSKCAWICVSEYVKADDSSEFRALTNLSGEYPGTGGVGLPDSKPHRDPQAAVNNHARAVVRFLRSAADSLSAVIGPPRRPEKK